eukprot:4397871-Pleurochrysis_carterae.AAC.1
MCDLDRVGCGSSPRAPPRATPQPWTLIVAADRLFRARAKRRRSRRSTRRAAPRARPRQRPRCGSPTDDRLAMHGCLYARRRSMCAKLRALQRRVCDGVQIGSASAPSANIRLRSRAWPRPQA